MPVEKIREQNAANGELAQHTAENWTSLPEEVKKEVVDKTHIFIMTTYDIIEVRGKMMYMKFRTCPHYLTGLRQSSDRVMYEFLKNRYDASYEEYVNDTSIAGPTAGLHHVAHEIIKFTKTDKDTKHFLKSNGQSVKDARVTVTGSSEGTHIITVVITCGSPIVTDVGEHLYTVVAKDQVSRRLGYAIRETLGIREELKMMQRMQEQMKKAAKAGRANTRV